MFTSPDVHSLPAFETGSVTNSDVALPQYHKHTREKSDEVIWLIYAPSQRNRVLLKVYFEVLCTV